MKKLFLILAMLTTSQAWATWTSTQVKGTSCTGTSTCAVTVTSTGSGHLLVAGAVPAVTGVTISSVTSAACTGAWTHVANSNGSASGDGSVDLYYCTNSASGQTSITITISTSANFVAVIWEASSTLGNIALDSGATPAGTKNDSSTCTSCTGTSLTLSGNNDFIVGLAACGNTCTGLTGTGWTNDLSNLGGDGEGHAITSGSQTAPATWTQSPTGTLFANAAAFQESSGAGAARRRALVISQ